MKRYCCLHGFGGSGRSFDQFRRHLPAEAEVVAPDLAGHGAPDAATFESEVQRLCRLLVEHSVGDAPGWHLVGYSLGGRLALGVATAALAQLDTDQQRFSIARLTLIGANPGLAEPDARAQRRDSDDQWAKRIEQEGLVQFFAAWRSLPLFASQGAVDAAVLAEQQRINISHDAVALAAAMRSLSLGRMPNYGEQLDQLAKVSAVIGIDWVAGSLDSKFTALAKDAAAKSRGRFIVVEGVGHNVLLEAPSRLAEIVSD